MKTAARAQADSPQGKNGCLAQAVLATTAQAWFALTRETCSEGELAVQPQDLWIEEPVWLKMIANAGAQDV